MNNYGRRSVLASGASLAAGGLFASAGMGEETTGESPEPVDEPNGWSSYRGNARNSAYVATDSFLEPDTLAWEYEETGNLAAANGTVYLRTDDGEIHALDAQNGELEWKRTAFAWTQVEFNPQGTPAVAYGMVYIAGNQLTALDAADGSVKWKATFDGAELVTNPIVAYDTVYVIADGTLYAFDAADGDLLWQLDTVGVETWKNAGETVTLKHTFKPITIAIAEERVYAITEGEDYDGFAALDARTGEVLWTDLKKLSSIRGPIIITHNRILFQAGAHDGAVVSSDSRDEAVYTIGYGLTPASRDDIKINGSRYTLFAEDSERRWSHEPGGIDPFYDPVIVGDTVITYLMRNDARGDSKYQGNAILGFDIEDGSMKWSISSETIEGGSISTTYVVSQDTLYVRTDDGILALRSSREDPVEEDDSDSDDESTDDETEVNETDDEEPIEDNGESDGDDEGSDGDELSGDEADQDETEREDDSGVRENDESVDTPRDEENQDETNETDGDDSTINDEIDGNDETADDKDPDENGDQQENIPGFTTSTGIVGGALSLEWLRRHAAPDEPEE